MSASAPLTQAMIDVLDERRRQVTVEGWTPEHDDRHSDGELARAAASYAYVAGVWDGRRDYLTRNPRDSHLHWPWDEAWWKPSDRRRDLVKAAALAIAEIERIDRVAAKAAPS